MNEIFMSWPWYERAIVSLGFTSLVVSLISMHYKLDKIMRLLKNRNDKG